MFLDKTEFNFKNFKKSRFTTVSFGYTKPLSSPLTCRINKIIKLLSSKIKHSKLNWEIVIYEYKDMQISRFHSTISPYSSHPFRFISSALVMVHKAWLAGTLATHGPIILGLHCISSLDPTLCWTRVEDIFY